MVTPHRNSTAARHRSILPAGFTAFASVVMLALCATNAHAQIGLYELARFDLSLTANPSGGAFIGGNPVAVGYNGSKLYVAGLNSGTTTANVSIVEITNASATGLNITPTYSTPFGSLSTVGSASRGYTGLAMNGSRLAAGYDSGTNTPTAFQMFDAVTNSFVWSLANSGTNTANIGTTRGYGGPDFDPGYLGVSGSGGGLAWVTQGQGRRFLNDLVTGTAIYTTTANVPAGAAQGMIINTNPVSTTWRDIAFDPATGNMYTRVNNDVSRTNRTGSNTNVSLTGTAGQSTLIVNLTDANQVGSNLGYMNSIVSSTSGSFSNAYAGDALIFNDRSLAGTQNWTDVIKIATTSGTTIAPSWTFLTGTTPTGGTIYDFEWDSASQTLAVVDYTNRNVSIFSTAVPEPTTTLAVGICTVGLAVMTLRRRGT
ncbi:MAG: hypothetical protein ACKO40_13135 [Planctomycetaceae bacterium]